ncbi:MAG: 6-bladed beta-propeller [Candidatus Nomurabacteria bacterium]|nr:6-bladed beta-propeller [Candidatus Nomurabacteria bacterium]
MKLIKVTFFLFTFFVISQTIYAVAPQVTTGTSSSETETGATLSGTLDFDGGTTTTARGFEYGTTIAYGSTTSESGVYTLSYSYFSQFGSSGTGDGQFSSPIDIVVDSSDNIYVSDAGVDRVQKFDSTGTYITQWGTTGTGDGQFNNLKSIAVDSSDNIYVVDDGNDRVQKFDSTGTYITQWGTTGTGDGQFSSPWGIDVDSSDNIYVGDISRVQKFTSAGAYVSQFGSAGSGDGQFTATGTRGIAIDSSDNIYVVDVGAARVQKFNSSGVFVTKWGSSGSGDGQFFSLNGLDVDSYDYVYVADLGNDRIQKFDSVGTFVTKWGTSGTGDGQLNTPINISFNSVGKAIVSDFSNSRIQIFYYSDSPFSLSLSSLVCNTLYHFRAFGTNADGTGVGSDGSFSTSVCPTTNSDSFFPPPSCEFLEAEQTITRGEKLKLRWKVLFEPGWEGYPYILRLQNPFMIFASSVIELVVTPNKTTTYDLYTINMWGSRKCSTTVNVVDPLPYEEIEDNKARSCSLSAEPSSISPGEETVISWVFTDGDKIVIDNIGTFIADGFGSQTFTESTTIIGEVSGGIGLSNCSVSIKVVPDPVLPPTEPETTEIFTAPYCPYFTGYIHLYEPESGENNPDEVLKVKKFLNIHQGAGLDEDKIVNLQLHEAIQQFQSEFQSSVLSPWGLGVNNPTGYWYKATVNQANKIVGCNEVVVLKDPEILSVETELTETDGTPGTGNTTEVHEIPEPTIIESTEITPVSELPQTPTTEETQTHDTQQKIKLITITPTTKKTLQILSVTGPVSALPTLIPRLWSLLMSFLGFRKKHRPWGTVYNSVTKQPLDPAYVTLHNELGEEVASAITDPDGRYSFVIAPGTYIIRAQKTHFISPSTTLNGKLRDVLYSDLYFGETIVIKEKGQVITKNIPMDPTGEDWNEKEKQSMGKTIFKFFSKYDRSMITIINILFWVGFISSITLLFVSPVLLNIIIVALYVAMTILMLLGFSPTSSGRISYGGNPLPFAIIRIYNATLNKEVAHKVADENGHYFSLVQKGNYYITVEAKNIDDDYVHIYTSEEFNAKKGIVNMNVKL